MPIPVQVARVLFQLTAEMSPEDYGLPDTYHVGDGFARYTFRPVDPSYVMWAWWYPLRAEVLTDGEGLADLDTHATFRAQEQYQRLYGMEIEVQAP